MALSFGSMFASLTLESTSFMSGLEAARKSLGVTQKRFADIGGSMQKIGAVMTVGLTAPFTALAGAALSGAREMAGSVVEIQKSAQLANVSTSEFQRLAFAVKSVGFEADKLTDVYKDVNDRVGEFLSTGGGEMKDFFEKVAPKVGVTAEAFRNLSGPQALQLYYNSLIKAGLNQQQVTFYMEAMADEASALVPLLQNNGKAMAEMGGKAAVIPPETMANLKRYTDAQKEMEQALQKVTIAIVSSGLLEGVTNMVTSITELTGQLASANPELFKWGVTIGGAAALLGPVVAGIGTFVTAVGSVLPVLAAMRVAVMTQAIPALVTLAATAAPIALPIIAVGAAITGIVVAIRNWDKIKPYVDKVVGWMGAMYAGVKTWLQDKLGAVLNWVLTPIRKVADAFKWLDDVVVRHSYVPDLVDSIGQHIGRLDTLMVAPIARMTKAGADAFAQLRQSVQGTLDGLFPEEAEVRRLRAALDEVNEAYRQGMMPEETWRAAREKLIGQVFDAEAAARAAGKMPSPLPQFPTGQISDLGDLVQDNADKIEAANDNTIQSFAEMARDVAGSLGSFAQAVKSGDWLSALQGALDVIGQIAGIINGTGQPATRTFSIDGARANGGPVMPGRNYLVGERGPEILRMGGRGGSIVPNDQLGGGGVMRLIVEEAPGFASRVVGLSDNVAVERIGQSQRSAAMRERQRL